MTDDAAAPPHVGQLVGRLAGDARDGALLPVVLPDDARHALAGPAHVWDGRPDRHPALVYLVGRAASSRRPLRQALDVVAALLTGGRADHVTLPWHLLRYPHAAAVRAALAERYEPAGARLKLAALKGVLREAWRLGYLDAESYHRAVDLPAVRGGNDVPAGRELTPGEIRALLEACAADPSPAGVRDAAVLALLYGAGLRRAEAVRLDVGDVAPDGPDAGTLTVLGKGNKRALAYARGASLQVLRAWLARRHTGPNASDAGRLLLPVSQTGVVVHTRQLSGRPVAPASLSEYAVYLRLKVRAVEAGVRPFSPHDCRRTFAGDLLDAGADLNTVKELLRHASISTTARYDRRGERAKRAAADLLHFPHVRF